MTSPCDADALLYCQMEDFLRAGGMFTYSEWADLSVEQRAAMLVAQERIRLERTLALAAAIRDEKAAGRLGAILDGGDALVHESLEAVADRVLRRAGG